MDTYKILVEGYAYPGADSQHFFASPTVVLIYSNDKKVIIDPGADKPKLLAALEAEGLTTSDIDIVFLTHWHPDHFLNIRLFPDHDIMDATTVWKDTGEEFFPEGETTMSKIPGTNIEILPTPGHRDEHVALLIDTDQGKVCFAQDVFWWVDGEQPQDPQVEHLMQLQDPFMARAEQLQESRKKVLEVADWIVPGHGKIFKNPNK